MKASTYINANYCETLDRERNYKKHLQNLNAIKTKKKAVISEHTLVLDNVKNIRSQNHKYLRNEKEDTIQKDNNILLGHIVQISTRESAKVSGSLGGKEKRTQTSPGRSKKNYLKKVEEERIKSENLSLARRLMEVDENVNKELENHMELYNRISRTKKKVQQSQGYRVVVKSVENNRRALNKMKLPPISRERSSHNTKTLGEESDDQRIALRQKRQRNEDGVVLSELRNLSHQVDDYKRIDSEETHPY